MRCTFISRPMQNSNVKSSIFVYSYDENLHGNFIIIMRSQREVVTPLETINTLARFLADRIVCFVF